MFGCRFSGIATSRSWGCSRQCLRSLPWSALWTWSWWRGSCSAAGLPGGKKPRAGICCMEQAGRGTDFYFFNFFFKIFIVPHSYIPPGSGLGTGRLMLLLFLYNSTFLLVSACFKKNSSLSIFRRAIFHPCGLGG